MTISKRVTGSARITPDAPTWQGVQPEGYSAPFLSPPYGLPPYPMEYARVMLVAFEPDPDAIRAAVPEPLEWVEDSLAVASIGDHRQMPFGLKFQEWLVAIKVRFNGETGRFVPYIWTSADEPTVIGREVMGWPKLLCDHNETQVMGSQASAVITRRGETLLRASVALEEVGKLDDLPLGGALFTVRKVQMPQRGAPALKQVIRYDLGNSFKLNSLWQGRGFVEMPGQAFSAVHRLMRKSTDKAWLMDARWELGWGEILWENWVPPTTP